MGNRIRELREQRGMTTAQLAAAAGTSQPQITRLERGERKLSEEWMVRIAAALGVTPADLLASATLAEVTDDVEPYRAGEFATAAYLMKSDVLEQIELPAGSLLVVDTTEKARERLKTGDVVIARLRDASGGARTRLIARQFIAPSLLVTNRRGANTALHTHNDAFRSEILGVAVPDADELSE